MATGHHPAIAHTIRCWTLDGPFLTLPVITTGNKTSIFRLQLLNKTSLNEIDADKIRFTCRGCWKHLDSMSVPIPIPCCPYQSTRLWAWSIRRYNNVQVSFQVENWGSIEMTVIPSFTTMAIARRIREITQLGYSKVISQCQMGWEVLCSDLHRRQIVRTTRDDDVERFSKAINFVCLEKSETLLPVASDFEIVTHTFPDKTPNGHQDPTFKVQVFINSIFFEVNYDGKLDRIPRERAWEEDRCFLLMLRAGGLHKQNDKWMYLTELGNPSNIFLKFFHDKYENRFDPNINAFESYQEAVGRELGRGDIFFFLTKFSKLPASVKDCLKKMKCYVREGVMAHVTEEGGMELNWSQLVGSRWVSQAYKVL